MAPKKTRNTSATHLSRFVSRGKQLLLSELHTARDILRYEIFLRETSVRIKETTLLINFLLI